ncbi:Zn(2)-C6 fungal-type domain-containing protein [Fusarium keratoplasticum]|uniref:Zn(2)-C6 fungal-type domain-containing protein n=1 Tax=Fusarium keratoplasticum TaxID=1328300 RepID=A0ACC0QPD9_9HYPO|nr:Zn(2)-C6 fungal-type domain-containing protein [Fusarium keratoplasticum]KAI8660887.1 Zn(2)-C6 fungal-type domain-containing protein [Fusarium keratoplasticum]
MTVTTPVKPKFKRAFSHKTHMVPRIRRVKCDEEKPTCRRCINDKFKCDGYAMPPKRKNAKSKAKAEQRLAQQTKLPLAISEAMFLTDWERFYFHHFLHWTAKQLLTSPDSSNFWLRYAFPLAHHCEAVRYSMVAVGASHRLFMARSAAHLKPFELERIAIRQYNKAIAVITPSMSADSVYNRHCILICCLLFVSVEGLMGRYDDLLRHLRSGNQLLSSSLNGFTPDGDAVNEKLVDMFSRLSTESSNFCRKNIASGVSLWYQANANPNMMSAHPFRDLDEASYELQRLSVRRTDNAWYSRVECEDDDTDDVESENRLAMIHENFAAWNSRFEAMTCLNQANLPVESSSQLRNLCLAQQFWKLTSAVLAPDEPISGPISDPTFFYDFMAAATSAAEPLIAMNQPTFSLDGDLISGLNFVAALAIHPSVADVKIQALDLLRRLNRREGVWDSRDVVRLYELMAAADEES